MGAGWAGWLLVQPGVGAKRVLVKLEVEIGAEECGRLLEKEASEEMQAVGATPVPRLGEVGAPAG